MSVAYKYEKATVLVPFSYLNILMLLVIDLVVFKYEFKFLYFVGFMLTLIFVLTPIFYKIYTNQKVSASGGM